MAMTFFVAGPRQGTAKMGATLKKRWETRDQMIGPKPHDQKELPIRNRTLRWCKNGLVFAANLRHGREVVDELGRSKSKPVSSPATGDGAMRCQSDELKPLDEEGKRLYQRIVAKLNYLAYDRLDLKYATSCLASSVSSPSLGGHAGGETSWTLLEESTCCLAGFPLSRPTAWRALVLHGCRLGPRKDFSKVNERRCHDSRWWSPQLLGEEAKECCTVKLGKRAVRSHHVGHEIFGDPEMDLGYSCSVTVATDSQSVIDHTKRRGHSVASKHVGLRGLWLQEAPVGGKLKLEKVDTAVNPSDVCTKALPRNRIRELCRLARVYVCCSEGTMGDGSNERYLSRLDELCRGEKFEQSCDAESEGAC